MLISYLLPQAGVACFTPSLITEFKIRVCVDNESMQLPVIKVLLMWKKKYKVYRKNQHKATENYLKALKHLTCGVGFIGHAISGSEL